MDLDDEELKATKRMNGTLKDEDEDIKILEDILEPFREQNNKGKKLILNITGIKYNHYQALENLLTKYKKLVEIEAEHQRINGELREKVKELEKTQKTLEHNYQVAIAETIHKSEIEEKIEELESFKGLVMYEKYNYEVIIRHLQDLLKEDQ